jgi:chromosome segregation ATPase
MVCFGVGCACVQVARASGERSDEEKKQLQGRIAELTVELETASGTEKMLLAQTKRLKDELKRVQRKQADMEVQLASLQSRATEIELSNKSSEEAVRAATKEKEETMVQHDVLQVLCECVCACVHVAVGVWRRGCLYVYVALYRGLVL